MSITANAVARARAVLHSDRCQCGASKPATPTQAMCDKCMKRLPLFIRSRLDTEMAEPFLEFYDEAVQLLRTFKRADEEKTTKAQRRRRITLFLNALSLTKQKHARIRYYACEFCACPINAGDGYRESARKKVHEFCYLAVAREFNAEERRVRLALRGGKGSVQ